MQGFTSRLPAFRSHMLLAISLSFFALSAAASSLEQAKRIYDRLAGVPPSAVDMPSLKAMIDGDPVNGPILVANAAMTNKAFYNATLKNWITPWTNRDGDKFAPLNDYTATVIGVIRDSLDYRTVLYGNVIYVPANLYGAYSTANNAAYVALEAADADMGNTSVLINSNQDAVTGLPADATAGVITTRAAARAFFIDGTNRAMFRFTLKNHLCNDMEQVQDTTRPSDRIRRDVSRSPGGDSRIFMNTCIGCHSGMDPMAQAFAYYNYEYKVSGAGDMEKGKLEYHAGTVDPKYHINENHFIEGYNTPDNHWNNYWRSGPNTAIFGWDTALSGSGTGAQSMLTELANSEAFATCSVKKVFKAVCLRDPAESDRTQTVNGIAGFNQMLTDFKTGGYKLKKTFAQAAVYCSGN